MDNQKKSCRPTARRLTQLYAALLYNAHLRGFVTGKIYRGSAKYACTPGLNCYSCPGAAVACPLGALQNALASAGHRAPWYILGILLLYGVILGRTVCGWLCPVGLIQELLHKIPSPKIKKSRVTRALSRLKYGILAVFVIALPLWYGLRHGEALPAFCKYICPAGTLEGAVGLLAHPANASMRAMLGALFTRKWVILLAVGLISVFCYRSFCRFLCPLGVIYGLFNRFCVVGMRVDADRCVHCGRCVRDCQMDVRRVGDAECIHCGKCVDVCARGAIALRAGNITLKAAGQPKKRHPVIQGVALAALAAALIWFNWLDPAVAKDAPAAEPTVAVSEIPVGHEVGQRLEDFTLRCYDGTEFRLGDTRGKITVINLWATYCPPCIAELPYFSALADAHAGDVAVLAVHPSLVIEDPQAFIAGRDLHLAFATDTADADVAGRVGAAGVLPQTVILDRQGVVIFNAVGSVTPELLEETIAPLL